MQVQFASPLADSKDFPAPKVRAAPAKLTFGAEQARVLAPQVDSKLVFNRARYALYLCACHLPQQLVWIPAYHCPALVEPFLAAGKRVAFYPMKETLQPEKSFLTSHLTQDSLIIGIRFFGFTCEMEWLAALCASTNSIFIEDLAHAAYAEELYGHIGVTSLAKFLPTNGGAELLFKIGTHIPDELQQVYRQMKGSWREQSEGWVNRLGNKFLPRNKSRSTFRYFDVGLGSKNLSATQKKLLTSYDHLASQRCRRENFNWLLDNLKDSPLGVPLFSVLEGKVVPYIFPFLLHDASFFKQIRQAGIQLLRWEELAQSPCQISQNYRQRLVQIPVHQDLTREQLHYLAEIFDQAPRGPQ